MPRLAHEFIFLSTYGKSKCRARLPNLNLTYWQIKPDLFVQSEIDFFSKSRFSVFCLWKEFLGSNEITRKSVPRSYVISWCSQLHIVIVSEARCDFLLLMLFGRCSFFNIFSPNLYSFVIKCCFGRTAACLVCQAP